MANIGFHKIIVVCRFLVLVQTYLYQSVFLFYLWLIFSSNTVLIQQMNMAWVFWKFTLRPTIVAFSLRIVIYLIATVQSGSSNTCRQ